MSEFKREIRYEVIKYSDLSPEELHLLREFIEDNEISTRDCVVVESDWPIHEDVWDMIQRMDEGRPQKVDELNVMLQDAQWAMAQAEESLEDVKDNWHEAMAENVRLRAFIKKWEHLRGVPLDLVSDYNQVIK